MLIEFTVKNYRSIREAQTFSMVKSSGAELDVSNTFLPNAPASIPLLRSAAIYGANAAGKSNLVRAMKQMEKIVLSSASSSQQGDQIPVTPFIFDENSSSDPSEFEVVFVNEGVRFQYGFSATKTQIVDEWLIAFPKGRAQKWFTRKYNKKSKSSNYKFGDALVGQKAVWQNSTRSNALFLSTAVQLNSEQLKPVFNWFKEKFRPVNVGGWGDSFTAYMCESDASKIKVLEFLKAADFNIFDVKITKETFDPDTMMSNVPPAVREAIASQIDDEGFEVIDIKTVHKTASGKLVSIDIDEESDGTQQFFSYVGPWIDALSKGYVLVIDELNSHLHPKMVRYLVDLFHNSKVNKKNAQLIFTTHETSILNQDVFRRDQIWFCEKNKEQVTSVYPLTDFSPRKDRENLELGYLSGRYGAVPFVTSFNMNEM